MDLYNVKIYYYETGTQYRVYSRPVTRMSEDEREKREQFIALHGKPEKKQKLHSADELTEIPFSAQPVFARTFEEVEKEAERSLQVSLNRTKQNLIGICRANRWDYFITFTFNPRLVNSKNYEEVCIKAGQYMNNLKKRHCPEMKYVLVPELHSDGEKYHLHGLIGDCIGLQLRFSGKVKNGRVIYNIPSWKYGWNTATEVTHSGKVANYISKYITKDVNGLLHGKRRYWCSHNTILPQEVCDELYVPDYMSVIQHLSESNAINFIKKCHVSQCNRDIWYIET